MVVSYNRLSRWYGEPGDPPPPTPTPPRTFTQEEVNRFVADERRKLSDKLTETQAEMERMRVAGGDVTGLKAKVQELQNSLLSKEEIAKKQADDLKIDYETKLTESQKREKEAVERYNNTLIEREIAKAANQHIAYDETGAQIQLVIGNKAKVVEELDAQGRPTGVFRVKVASKTADGKDIDIDPAEAVAAMRADRKYANLFKVDKSPGTGTLNTVTSISDPNGPIPTNTDAYMAQRAELKKQGRI